MTDTTSDEGKEGEVAADGESTDVNAAFTTLYQAHYSPVRAYASACVSAGDVDDIVAETFLVAWRRWENIPAEWARGWLIGVARNVVRTRQRASRRSTAFIDQLAVAPKAESTAVDERHLVGQDVATLRAAMATLKTADQELLVLAGPHELSLEEVALAFGITANAAGVRVHRARERLRAAFAKKNSEGGAAA